MCEITLPKNLRQNYIFHSTNFEPRKKEIMIVHRSYHKPVVSPLVVEILIGVILLTVFTWQNVVTHQTVNNIDASSSSSSIGSSSIDSTMDMDVDRLYSQKIARSIIYKKNIKEFSERFSYKTPQHAELKRELEICRGVAFPSVLEWDFNSSVSISETFDALSLNCRKTVVESLFGYVAISTQFGNSKTLQDFILYKLNECGLMALEAFMTISRCW